MGNTITRHAQRILRQLGDRAGPSSFIQRLMQTPYVHLLGLWSSHRPSPDCNRPRRSLRQIWQNKKRSSRLSYIVLPSSRRLLSTAVARRLLHRPEHLSPVPSTSNNKSRLTLRNHELSTAITTNHDVLILSQLVWWFEQPVHQQISLALQVSVQYLRRRR